VPLCWSENCQWSQSCHFLSSHFTSWNYQLSSIARMSCGTCYVTRKINHSQAYLTCTPCIFYKNNECAQIPGKLQSIFLFDERTFGMMWPTVRPEDDCSIVMSCSGLVQKRCAFSKQLQFAWRPVARHWVATELTFVGI